MPDIELTLRIVVVCPPREVLFGLQGKPGELVQQVRSTGDDLIFDVPVRVAGAGLRLLGKFVQGPPSARFVYISSGTMAGDASSCWTRRAKVPLSGITESLIAKGRAFEARIGGTAKDGGPACATVPLLGSGWRVVRSRT